MGKFFSRFHTLLACLAFVFLLTPPALDAGQADNILRFGVHVSAMGSLDPHFAAASQDRAFADMVFNGLLRYVPGNAPKIEPDLAVEMPKFRMERNQQVWTIQLREGVFFQPGPDLDPHELTADDVIFSLNKSADKNTSAYSGEYQGMHFKKIDRYSLEISLDIPLSSILFFPKLTNYGGGFIISKKAVKTMGIEGFKTHPVGTGPFIFKHYAKEESLELTAHRNYFRGKPNLEGVEFHFIPKIAQREAALKQGRVDVIIGSAAKGWIESTQKEPGIVIDTHGVGEVATIHMNTRMKPLDDIRVRKAIAYALGRDEFLDTMSSGITGKVASPVPSQFLPGGISLEEAALLLLDYKKNLDTARHLLREAGYPNGFSLDLVTSEKRNYQSYYYIIKDQLSQIGITCNITVLAHSEMHRAIRKDPKPLVMYVAWRPNADAYLTRFFHSDSIVVAGRRPDTNFSHYNKIDKIIEAARREIDPQAQVNLWTQAQIRILNDMAAFPVSFTRQCYARKEYVDYGHTLLSTMALYPQFTEKTRLISQK